MGDRRYEIAYQESLRALNDQVQAVDAIQARAGSLISASAVVASVGVALTPIEQSPVAWLAILSFLGVVVLAGIVLLPSTRWRFHFRASKLLWSYVEGPRPLTENLMLRDLALYLERYFDQNGSLITRLSWELGAATVFLFIEVSTIASSLLGAA